MFKDEQYDAEMLYLLLLTSVMCTLNLELACVQKSREELVHLWICFFSVPDLYVMIHRADCPGDVFVVAAPKNISGMALRLAAWGCDKLGWGGEVNTISERQRRRQKEAKKTFSVALAGQIQHNLLFWIHEWDPWCIQSAVKTGTDMEYVDRSSLSEWTGLNRNCEVNRKFGVF